VAILRRDVFGCMGRVRIAIVSENSVNGVRLYNEPRGEGAPRAWVSWVPRR
jgi:hypothetical protein